MRTIWRTGKFKRDYKREKRGRHRKTIDGDLLKVAAPLVNDEPLTERHHDHSLVGERRDPGIAMSNPTWFALPENG